MAIVLIALVSAVSILWHKIHKGVRRGERWVRRRRARRSLAARLMRRRRRAYDLIALGLVALISLTVYLCFAWLWRSSPLEALLLSIRSINLESGISPLLPLMLMGGAAVLWTVSALRRLRMLDGLDRKPAAFLGLNEGSFAGVRQLERQVIDAIGRPSVRLPKPAVIIATLLLVAAWMRLFFVRDTPTLEGPAFDWLFSLGLLAVYFGLLLAFIRFVFIWARLRRLLQRLGWHPTIEAYDRLRQRIPGKPKIRLTAPSQVFTALEFSVDRAGKLMSLARRMKKSAPNTTQGALTTEVVRNEPALTYAVEQAEQSLKGALAAESRGDWRGVIRKRARAESHLAVIAKIVAPMLERGWRMPADLQPEVG